MAYYEKYRKNITNPEGVSYRLAIYENRTSSPGSGYPMEIGGLVGLNFVFQGQQSDVFTPIVKTSIELTLVDVSDKPTVTASPMNIKQGNWEEFFTPDETLYKVSIARIVSGASTIFWTGYITPDSWQEGLDYRAPLTFTARDNWGHLQDFTFDMTPDAQGLVCILLLKGLQGGFPGLTFGLGKVFAAQDVILQRPVSRVGTGQFFLEFLVNLVLHGIGIPAALQKVPENELPVASDERLETAVQEHFHAPVKGGIVAPEAFRMVFHISPQLVG